MKKDIRFAFHILTHPFDGFYDMKYEKRGKLWLSMSLIAIWILSNIVSQQMRSFLFNTQKMVPVNIWGETRNVLVACLVFSVANWSITTLMDGKGRYKDILMVIGYASLPFPLLEIPSALLSNISAFSEQVYIQGLNMVAIVWFAFLLFVGIMTIHQYSLSKMLVTLLLTAVAAFCILFVCLLFFSLFSQMAGFVMGIVKEIQYRLW